MKDRTREAIFDLLGPAVVDKVAIDLFAGSGAMGLEAISRGAKRAVFVEQHVAARRTIEQNVSALGVEDVAAVVAADVFAWAARRDLPADGPWLVSCCPPYEFYTKRRNEMLQLIRRLVSAAPNDSVVVVEADRHFDVSDLPDSQQWDVRHYRPAVICIWRGILMTAS